MKGREWKSLDPETTTDWILIATRKLCWDLKLLGAEQNPASSSDQLGSDEVGR